MSGRVNAELVECDPQPECLSLDPGTRVKTHILRVTQASGELLWERSLYSQYDTREVFVTGTHVLVGYDDRVVAMTAETGEETTSHRMYLFEYFEAVPDNRVLIKEKGSIILLDSKGNLLWEHGGGEILASVLVQPPSHIYVHFWGGSDVAGLQVPFACLNLTTGALDLTGPPTPPSFDDLCSPTDIAGPGSKKLVPTLRENTQQLLKKHPSAWIKAMATFLG